MPLYFLVFLFFVQMDGVRHMSKNFKDFSVRIIPNSLAMNIVINKHYLKRKCSCLMAFGLFFCDKIVGVATFGKPPSYTLCEGIAGKEESNNVIEFNRLWVCDSMPKNIESWFISRAIKKCNFDIIVSFADIEHRHVGYVYQATNWLYCGVSKSRKYFRLKQKSRNVDESIYSRRERMSKKEIISQYGRDSVEEFYSSAKHRYIYINCGKKRKRELLSKLRYKIEKYPKVDKKIGDMSLKIIDISHFSDRRMFTCINEKFYNDVIKFSKYWTKDKAGKTYYARANGVALHRLVMELHLGRKLKDNEVVDHIDGCGLNNSIENLQLVDVSINNFNRDIQKNNKTGYRGVYFRKDQNPPYQAKVNFRDKTYGGYCYYTKEAAALKFDDIAKNIPDLFDFKYDEKRVLNFPNISDSERKRIWEVERNVLNNYKKNKKTKFFNILYDKSTNRWIARTPQINQKRTIIGNYKSQEDAAIASDFWIIMHKMENKKRLNFYYSDKKINDIRNGVVKLPVEDKIQMDKKFIFTSFNKKRRLWIAIPPNVNGKKIKEVGAYLTEKDAAHASDYYIIMNNIDKKTNFKYSDKQIADIRAGKLKVLTATQKKKLNK